MFSFLLTAAIGLKLRGGECKCCEFVLEGGCLFPSFGHSFLCPLLSPLFLVLLSLLCVLHVLLSSLRSFHAFITEGGRVGLREHEGRQKERREASKDLSMEGRQ